jgi:hypothetical protein
MLATRKASLIVLLVLAVCLMGSAPTYSQSSAIFNASKSPGNLTKSRAWLAKCQALSSSALTGSRVGETSAWLAVVNSGASDLTLPNALDALCVESVPLPTPRVPADNPCLESAAAAPSLPRVPGVPRTHDCGESGDTVLASLSSLGKAGVKIARAREEVLDILRSENACTEWFETKDAKPASTFQSLDFLLDHRGPHEILESPQADSLVLWRQPYVASATQDGGAHTAITINAHGAFYERQGSVLKTVQGGGPLRADGGHVLTVGSYQGGTLPAQMVTLLHELGHIIDLLPEDADNLDGKSVRNTDEVLRHCRGEVEARAEQAKQTAKR